MREASVVRSCAPFVSEHDAAMEIIITIIIIPVDAEQRKAPSVGISVGSAGWRRFVHGKSTSGNLVATETMMRTTMGTMMMMIESRTSGAPRMYPTPMASRVGEQEEEEVKVDEEEPMEWMATPDGAPGGTMRPTGEGWRDDGDDEEEPDLPHEVDGVLGRLELREPSMETFTLSRPFAVPEAVSFGRV
jgi:hypothetical protein